jgi:Ca2+-binding RTX toxin-like protein
VRLTSQSYGDALAGGAGDDTLTAGQGPNTLTADLGADRFVFGQLPWTAGHITDFQAGVDKIDIHGLVQACGYSGSDPVADGYVKLIDNGAGGTWIYFDTDGRGAADQWGTFVTTLDHVAPSSLTSTDWII